MRRARRGGLIAAIALLGPSGARAQGTPESAGRVAAVETAKDIVRVQDEVAEWDKETSHFDRMRTPDGPAFVILGVSPTEIQRPGTPMGVATSLSGFLSGSSIVIPRNLALEVAPYWLFGHPALTAQAYEQGGWSNLYRTLTLSLGTKQTDRQTTDAAGVTTDHADSDIGLGIRTRLYGGGPDKGKDCVKKIAILKQASSDLAAAAILPENEVSKLREENRDPAAFAAAIQKAQAEVLAASQLGPALAQARKDLPSKCFDLMASVDGLSLDLAGAADWFFADSLATVSNGDLRAAAGWLTVAYASDVLTAAFMGRYAGRQQETGWQHLLDGGLRVVYKRKSFALSGEGIARARLSGPGPSATYKVDIVAEQKIGDQTWVTVTFGKAFDAGQGGSLFSLANLNWAFGKPSIE